MKKKLLPISLLCLVGMILAGCGGSKSSNSQAPASSSGAPSSVVPSSSSVTPVPSSSSVAPSSSSSAPSSSSSSSSSSSQHQPVAVTGVALDKSSADVVKGQTLQLTATVAPENADNKEVTWSSSDPDVASVSNGLVTAEGIGQAKITVKTRDGGKTAECVINVIKEIESIEITNKDKFKEFIIDDMESINVKVLPEGDADTANVNALLAAGALKASSSNKEVATVTGLTVTALAAGKSTIEVELFGKKDSFELTVGDAIPGVPYTIGDALAKAIEEAPFNGKSGKDAAITTTCFELTGLILAVSPNGDTGYNAILDDGTGSVYLQISKESGAAIPLAVGDYAKVTCRLTNYYGLLEGVSRKAETGKSGSWVQAKDVEKLNAPETPIVPSLGAEPTAMTGAEYEAYFAICLTNGTKGAAGATFTNMKYVTIAAEYLKEYADADKGGYKISDHYGLAPYGFEMDKPFEGQKSTLKCYLIGANTGKGKSNAIVMDQIPLAVESVVIDQEPQTIVHGNTLQMTYTTTPAGSYSREVAWSSETEAVASIDENGLLTGLYVGEGSQSSNIKVKLGSGDDAKESPAVAISVFGETVEATNVVLDATASVYIGEEIKLSPVTTPAMVSDVPQWSSDNEAVATVSEKGVVKGLKEGVANITVKYNDSVSATCAVTVSPEPGIDIDHPLDVAGAIAIGTPLAHNTETSKVYFVKGFVSQIDYNFSESSTTATFWLANGDTVVKGFEGYKATLKDGLTAENFKVGAELILRCTIKKYSSTIENGSVGEIVSLSYEEHPATAIALKESEAISVGGTVKLAASLTPVYATSAVTWSSENDEVASVDQKGLVTGVSLGTVKIFAKVSDEIVASCSVLVSEPANEAAYNLKSLNSSNSAYASTYDVKFSDGKTWNIPGNQSLAYGTKIGGKLSAATDRVLYSKSAYDKVTGIDITHGSQDSAITVNSLKLFVYNSAADAQEGAEGKAVETVVGTYVNEGVTSFRPAAADGNWNGKFFRIVYNLSSSAASSNKGVVLTTLTVKFNAVMARPVGSFVGYATALDDSQVFANLALGYNKAYVELGSDKVTTTYSYNAETGAVSIEVGGNYGTLTATYDPANNQLKNVGISGAAAATLKNNNEITLALAGHFWNGDSADAFARRLRPASSWDTKLEDVELDKVHSVSGGAAIGRVGLESGNAVGLCLKNDFETAQTVKGIGFWVYNPTNSDIQLRTWVFTAKSFGTFAEIGKLTAKANGWTYCRMGMNGGSATIYNFNITVWKDSPNNATLLAAKLTFDDICLY